MAKGDRYSRMREYYRRQKYSDAPLTFEEQQQSRKRRTVQRERIVAPVVPTVTGLLAYAVFYGVMCLLDRSQPEEQEIEWRTDPDDVCQDLRDLWKRTHRLRHKE